MENKLQQNFQHLFEPELLKEIDETAIRKHVEAGEIIVDFDQTVSSIPLVLEGAVKVLREDEEGEELLLYFIESGDTCAMTLSCCMGHTQSRVRAEAETATDLLFIPVRKMEEWMAKYRGWQRFILDSYHSRMNELLETVDTLAFLNMEQRLLRYLRDKAMVTGNDTLQVTHKQIAQDLHTSRVVVSRLLKKLERQEVVEVRRNELWVKL